MGTFTGHIFMCGFLTTFGLYYIIRHIYEYFLCIRGNKTFRVRLTYGVKESWWKTFTFAIKISGGLINHFMFDRGARIHQHGTMEFCLMMACIVELAVLYKLPIHKDFQWWAWIQALLSYFAISLHHSAGHPSLGQFLHTLPLYQTIACVVALLLQLFHPHSLPIAVMFPAIILLKGMWFGLIAFVLYSPVSFIEKWPHPEDPHMATLIQIMFWMFLSVLIIISITFVIISRRYQPKTINYIKTDPIS